MWLPLLYGCLFFLVTCVIETESGVSNNISIHVTECNLHISWSRPAENTSCAVKTYFISVRPGMTSWSQSQQPRFLFKGIGRTRQFTTYIVTRFKGSCPDMTWKRSFTIEDIHVSTTKSITANSGNDVDIECVITGAYRTYNVHFVSENEGKHVVTIHEAFKSVLVIKNVTTQDARLYTCVVTASECGSGKVRQINSTTELHVLANLKGRTLQSKDTFFKTSKFTYISSAGGAVLLLVIMICIVVVTRRKARRSAVVSLPPSSILVEQYKTEPSPDAENTFIRIYQRAETGDTNNGIDDTNNGIDNTNNGIDHTNNGIDNTNNDTDDEDVNRDSDFDDYVDMTAVQGHHRSTVLIQERLRMSRSNSQGHIYVNIGDSRLQPNSQQEENVYENAE